MSTVLKEFCFIQLHFLFSMFFFEHSEIMSCASFLRLQVISFFFIKNRRPRSKFNYLWTFRDLYLVNCSENGMSCALEKTMNMRLGRKKNKPIEFLPDYLLILEFYSFSYQSIEFLTSYQIVEVRSKQNNYQVYICPILIKACFQYIFYKLQLHHFLCSSPQDNCEQYQKQKPFIIDFFFVVKRPQKLSFSDISVCVPTSYFIKIFIFSMPACSVVWWVTHSTSG